MLRNLLLTLVALIPVAAGANDYRGMPSGWPASSPGIPAMGVTSGYAPAASRQGYALYPANRPGYAPPLAYYAARPVQSMSTAYGTTLPSQAPTYSQVNYTQPTTTYYSPPAVTAYSPAMAAGVAPVYGISPQPGTMLQPQRVNYGAAGVMNFAPPAAPVMYRAYYPPAAGAVTYYRPVTVYQPATGQPVTCLQAVQAPVQTCGTAPAPCGSSCGSSGCGWNLFSWLCQRCTSSGCGTSCAPASCAPSGCGQQPYYPVVPVTPVQPYVSPVIPVVPAPTTTTPPLIGTPRVPPPPTRILGPGGAADIPPSLSPGGLPSTTTPITPAPAPSSTYTLPGTTTPGAIGTPGTTTSPLPASPYSPAAPALPADSYYPPSSDSGPSSSLRFLPPTNSATPKGVKLVPDPDAPTFKPANRAPQLINPSDRSAALRNPWAVVPAVWPTKPRIVAAPTKPVVRQPSHAGGRVMAVTNSGASRQLNERVDFNTTSAYVPQVEAALDDSGWSSGR